MVLGRRGAARTGPHLEAGVVSAGRRHEVVRLVAWALLRGQARSDGQCGCHSQGRVLCCVGSAVYAPLGGANVC